MFHFTILKVFFPLLLLANIVFAQDFEDFNIHKVEDKARDKYLKNHTLQDYRYEGDKTISRDESFDGNIIVIRGDLTVYGSVSGDVLVIFGDLHVRDGAEVQGNTTTIDGRIYQDNNAHITGNQIETHAKNLFPRDKWSSDNEYDYGYDESSGEGDGDWDWNWTRRFYGQYSTLPIKKFDDTVLLRYNRVQGLFFGLGIPQWIGSKSEYFNLHGFAGYGFKEKKWRYELGLDRWLFNRRTYRFEIGASVYDLTDTRDEWLLSTTENSLSAIFLNRDYQDFFRRSGYEIHAAQNITIFFRAKVAYRIDDYESLVKHTDWSLFGGNRDFKINPPIDEGNMRSIYAEFYLDTRDNIPLPRKGWYGLLSIETTSKNLHSDFSFNQYTLDVRRYQNLGHHERLDMRLMLGSMEGTDRPLQKLYQIGGVSTLRGYSFKEFVGDRLFMTNFEYNLDPQVLSTDLFFLDRVNLLFFLDAGNAWFSDPNHDNNWTEGFSRLTWNTLKTDFGAGLTFDHGKIRVSMAKRLDTGKKPFAFSLRLVKPF